MVMPVPSGRVSSYSTRLREDGVSARASRMMSVAASSTSAAPRATVLTPAANSAPKSRNVKSRFWCAVQVLALELESRTPAT